MACGTFKAAVDPDIAGLDSPLRLEATKVSQRWLDVFCVRLCLCGMNHLEVSVGLRGIGGHLVKVRSS